MYDIKENIFFPQIQVRLTRLTNLIEQNPAPQSNVSRGELGVIMYFFYLSRLLNDHKIAEKANLRLQKLLKQLTDGKVNDLMNSTLAGGLSGLGMVLEVLINEGFIEDEYDDFLMRVDHYVFENSLKKIKKEDTDFLHGGTGGFHYLYYRLGRNPDVDFYMREYLRVLDGITQTNNNGAYIKNAYMRTLERPDEINFGLSHGMSATILVLLNLFESEIQNPLAESLIREYIHFITSYKNTGHYELGKHSLFPNTVLMHEGTFSQANESSYLGGLRWCYGDLNIAHLLYKAGTILQEPKWIKLASQIGLSTLEIKDIEHARCHGSLFCHGATGIAHYYDFLQRISGLQNYHTGYEYWMKVAFSEFQKEEEHALYTDISGFFLEGAVGSGLVLMNAMQGEPGYWEKIWLLS